MHNYSHFQVLRRNVLLKRTRIELAKQQKATLVLITWKIASS